MLVVMIMRGSGFLRRALDVTTHIKNLFAFIGPAVFTCRVRHKRCLAGRAQTYILRLHRVVRTAASNAGS